MQSTEAPDGRRMAAWFRINFARCIYCGLCEEACPTSAIQLINEFKSCERDLLALVHEKEDLLIQGCGKDPDTCFYRYAGVVTARGDKGGHRGEAPPVDIHSNLP
jgi:NADH-quinone oxidoreductase subunit I